MTNLYLAPCVVSMVTNIETRSRLALLALLVAIASLTTTGCAISGDGKNLAYAVDGSAIVLGLGMGNTDNGSVPGDIMATLMGSALVVAGTVGLLTNFVINQNNTPESRPMPAGHQLSFHAPSPNSKILTPPGATPVQVSVAVQMIPPECQSSVNDWKAETHHERRYDLFRGMSASCRRVAVEL